MSDHITTRSVVLGGLFLVICYFGASNFIERVFEIYEMVGSDVSEVGYPRISLIQDFPTAAVEAEIHKHDRMIVEGMHFIRTLSPQELKRWEPTVEQKQQQIVCVNVYICNRDVPYIDTFMMGLMKGQSPARLNSYLQINLLNTERKPQRLSFPHLNRTLAKLPFVNSIHNFSANSSLDADIFRTQFFLNTIRGLEICLESNLPWCLVLEEDSITPVGFVDKLEEFVIDKLKGKEDQLSVVSLYAYYNLKYSGEEQLVLPKYSRLRYEKERAKSNAELQTPYHANYTLEEKEYLAGTVALLYSRASLVKVLAYLREKSKKIEIDADVYINQYFPGVIGYPRLHVTPSLVNHIGFYSARMGTLDGAMFTQLNTDVRFQFDAN